MQKRRCAVALAVLSAVAGCAAPHSEPPAVTDASTAHMTETPMPSKSVRKLTPDEEKTLLAPYRARIDVLDAQIVALLGQRFDVIREVAALKAENGIQPILPERIEEVVQRARAKAEKAGVAPKLVEQIYRIIIDTACKEEEEYSRAQQAKTQ